MKTLQYKLILLVGIFFIAGCGGGNGNSSTSTRDVTGSVSSSGGAALVKALVEEDCLADTVIATSSTGETISTAVADDCSFSLTLNIGKSYVISFVKGGEFVATLIFDSGIDGFTTATLPVGEGEGTISLGNITITGNVAIPTNEPCENNDLDDDGTNDCDDLDDDGDGINDDEEEDCDLDGFLDDFDDDSECEDGEEDGDLAKVREVKPRNDPHPELGEDTVDLDKKVRARISCEIDRSTVTGETFRVESDEDTIACTFTFSGTGKSGNRIRCEHDDQDFLPNTVYTATIDGVECLDGRAVETRSWSWLTEEEDDDEGDDEDDLDDDDDNDDDDD